jgi:ABC-type Fe3+ transport system substrate-binding protein
MQFQLRNDYFKLGLAYGSMVIAAVMAFASVGYAQAPTAELHSVIEAAKKEGKLKLAWAGGILGGASGATRLEQAINREYGTKLSFIYTPVGGMSAMAGRIAMEYAAHQPAFADLFVGSAAAFPSMLDRDVLLRVDWPKLEPNRLRPEVIEADDRAVRFGTGFQGADYNAKLAPMVPKTYQDFLRPEWKGKIATTSYAGGFEALARKDVWGPKRTIDYVTRLILQVNGFIGCADQERLVSGEFIALVTNCMGTIGPYMKRHGAPLESMIPTDALIRRYYYMAIPKNSVNPNAAKLLITFLLSEKGQALAYELQGVDLHQFPGSHSSKTVARYEAQGRKFTDFTIESFKTHPEMKTTLNTVIKMFRKMSR